MRKLKESKFNNIEKLSGNKGITIIILLILAGTTVGLLTGENNIINQAGEAKEDTEIANEKEVIENAQLMQWEKTNMET